MKITYNPGIAEDLLKNFTTLYNNGMLQVHNRITYYWEFLEG